MLRIVMIFLLSIVALLVVVGYVVFLRPQYMYTERSPDGKYTMEIYRKPLLFAMPGGGSDHMAKIILRDGNGTKLGEVGENSACGVLYRDIEVSWDLENNFAFYARGNAFNVKTGLACE